MAIFAISDLHLSFNTDKPMDVFGACWENYTQRMQEQWNKVVQKEDLVIIPGDISWAMYLEETALDFSYIDGLNGTKLFLRGNHDYWWTTLSKMEKYVEEKGFSTIRFLKNTAFIWEDVAICGTRGWTIPSANATGEDKKIYDRERQRLLLSLEDAKGKGGKKTLVAMHFPPVENLQVSLGFLDMMQAYDVSVCIFGHLHADAHKSAPQGKVAGIELKLVSCDYLKFTPLLVSV